MQTTSRRGFLSRCWPPCAITFIAILCLVAVIERNRIRSHWWAWRLGQTVDIRQQEYLLACLTSVGPDSASSLARIATHSDANLRLIAVIGLSKLPPIHAIPELTRLMSDPAIEVRLRAATSLAFFGTPAATEVLCRASRSESTDEAAAALAGLARMPARLALPALCDATRDNRNPLVRAQAIESLGEHLAAEPPQIPPACDPLGPLIESLDDVGQFEGHLAIEFEIQQATAAAAKSASKVARLIDSESPSRRTVGQLAASILKQATGLSIVAGVKRADSEQAELVAHCRAALKQRATPPQSTSSSPTTSQSR